MSARVLVTVAVLLALAGCGSAAADKPTHVAASTSSAAPTDPYDTYTTHAAQAGIVPEIQRSEAVKVAGNTCDNTVDDMVGLITSVKDLYTSTSQYKDFLTDRAIFIDVYCPGARVVYDAATQQAVGQVIPAAH